MSDEIEAKHARLAASYYAWLGDYVRFLNKEVGQFFNDAEEHFGPKRKQSVKAVGATTADKDAKRTKETGFNDGKKEEESGDGKAEGGKTGEGTKSPGTTGGPAPAPSPSPTPAPPPSPAPTSAAPPAPQRRQIERSLRCVSWLWETTVPTGLNPYGHDGVRNVRNNWPGDNFTECRQWHGIDIGFDVVAGRPVNVSVTRPKYVGISSLCGMRGRANETDFWTTSPARQGQDATGHYVEVDGLMGSRVGVYHPDIDVGMERVYENYKHGDYLRMIGAILFSPFTSALEEIIEDRAEEGYTGTNTDIPKIYSHVRFRVYANGQTQGGFVSNTASNGHVSTNDIVRNAYGYSRLPEHHVYVGGALTASATPNLSDPYDHFVEWIDSYTPYEVFASTVVAHALIHWCQTATAEEKAAAANTFKREYPAYALD